MRRLALLLLPALALAGAWPRLARSAPAASELEPEAVKGATDRGATWLKARQQPDGSFLVRPEGKGKEPPGTFEAEYTEGTTALALLALLECGTRPDDPVIDKGFDWLYERRPRAVYSVAMTILAIEARFTPRAQTLEKNKDKPYETIARQDFKRIARPVDKHKLEELVGWLLSKQEKHVWRYPSTGKAENEDHSNSQYVLLALKSASRLGCEVPVDVFRRVAEHFVWQQDPTGPEVPSFHVPAADGPIVPWKPDGTTVDRSRDPQHALQARGWCYRVRPVPEPEEPPSAGTREKAGAARPLAANMASTGAMTNSGVAALVVCKSELEARDKGWWRRWGPSVDQGIRDGCAWLALNFSVTKNPGGACWFYYYLYGLERAGVLAGTYELGTHDWYDEGARHLLELQTPDGCWPAESLLSSATDTCFALLFLRRATVPLVKLPPKRTITGVGG